MNHINLDVGSYSIKDLLQFANIFNKNINEVTEKEIEDGTNTFIRNSVQKQQPKYTHFFQTVQATLLNYLKAVKKNEIKEEKIASIFSEKNDSGWSESYKTILPKRSPTSKRGEDNSIIDDTHQVTQRGRIPTSETVARTAPIQGILNPNLKNTTSLIINIDSHYRKMIGPPSILNANAGCTAITNAFKARFPYSESASNFTVNLSTNIKNVISIKLQTIEIPVSWYVFSPKYGTTSFRICMTSPSGELFYPIDIPNTSLITIPQGNYNPQTLINAIQSALPDTYSITLDIPTQKVTIQNITGNPCSIFFYLEPSPPIKANPDIGIPWDIPAVNSLDTQCSTHGAKVDYHLGWLLGFRKTHYTGASSYTSEAPIDTYGTRYIYVILDDFKRNHLNQDMISSYTDKDTFNRPKTINSCKSPPSFSHVVPIITRATNAGKCRLLQPPVDAEQEVVTQKWFAKKELNTLWKSKTYQNRYRTWTGSDTIARIQVNLNKNTPIAGAESRPKYILLSEKERGIGVRNYFGPVTLSRLNLKLVNDKGYLLDLNNMDWSCQFEIKSIYQY
tara:strand:- start:93 stop:1778 length:1686 start_codon:yes stop_codon:yes gene_type:complete